MFRTEVHVATMTVSCWLERFCKGEAFRQLCAGCPEHGNNWSCPPGVPDASEILAGFCTVQVIGVQVQYSEQARQLAKEPGQAAALRKTSYEIVKRRLNDTLIELEQELPGSWTIAAGRCEQCPRCSRLDRRPCIKPERKRYSFSAFGFDLSALARETLGLELLWEQDGLPLYEVALAAFLML